MQALLLAAGRSTRFFPLPDKNFLRLGGKTLIEYQVAAVEKAGIKKIIIAGGAHNIARLRELFPKHVVVEQEKLDHGMAGAILAAKDYLKTATLILSTNDIFDPAAIHKILDVKRGSGAILAREVTDYFPGGYLNINESGRVTRIVEKPEPGELPSNYINIVCHLHRRPQVLITKLEDLLEDSIRNLFSHKKTADDLYEQALDHLFQKEIYTAVIYTAPWQAVKYPWHALDAAAAFLKTVKKKKARTAVVAKSAVVTGDVVLADGVRVMDHATIVGPAFIGKNTVVGTGSLVRESVVGENSVVGSQSEVARSLLGNQVWLHRNYVGDSIIADNVSLGAGATTGNLRLDEAEIEVMIKDEPVNTQRKKYGAAIGQGVRIGVGVQLMPGVTIGENSFVSSGLVVDTNIPADSFVKGEVKLSIRKNTKKAPPRDV